MKTLGHLLTLNLLFVLGFCAVGNRASATVSLPFHDAFTYAEGNLYTVAAGVWDAGGNTGSEITVSSAAALTAPAGLATASGKGVRWSPSGTARRAVAQFTSVPNTDNNTVYASFLLSIQTAPSSGVKLIGYLESSTSSTTSPQLGIFVDSSSRIGIGKKATSPAVLSSALGTSTHLVVVRYTFLASGNDQADLWVDPANSSYGAASPPASLGSTTGSSDPSALAYFQINTPSGAGPLLYLDEVRIATNWAGVTPTNGAVAPPAAPVVTNAWMATNGFVLQGTNGAANSIYGVLTATNLAGAWTLLATNNFDADGHFASTNPLLPGSPQQFYRLQVGNLPELPVAPAITSQPQNRTVGEGQNATFTVGASGTAPLHYQWYSVPGILLAGKTNTALTLSAVTTNQSGSGYFAIVTNLFGAATSSVASLTVTSTPPTAPAITTQPQNQQVNEGQTAAFTVVATGTPPLFYQWYFNTNTALADATNATLTLLNVQSNNAGGYSVIVTNSVGSRTSVVATLTVYPAPTNGTFYVATNGNDANPGTLAEPFATIPTAVALAGPGATIYVRGGTHYYSSTIRIERSGSAGSPIRLLAYPGEQPVLNFTNQPYGSNNRGILITTNGNWWEFKGLEICYAGDNGIKVEGSHHRFEQCVFHHNGDTGLQIGFGHDDDNPDGQLAAFIEVINCDSSYNYDSDSNGGDADGFAAKMHCGRGIVFTGCRAWYNSDDGWDLYETDYSVVISNCWTWKSAYVGQGNGNGFKLGGNGTGGDSRGTHCAYNCVAFGCKVNGFTQNSHKDGEIVVNCLGFSNGSSGYNFYFEGSLNSGKVNAFTNNASLPRSGTNGGGFIEDNSPIQVNNSWNLSVTVSSADYADITEAAAGAARQADGSLPTGFARLVSGSDLIDKGVDVGQPYNGTAPDLGPYEYAP
jgi:pectate disaccharide-lyase